MAYQLLFVCTANYYRSRFAELLFNARAGCRQLNCVAASRGIATELGAGNVGPISRHTVERLRRCGVNLGGEIRFPVQLQETDLVGADLVIALDEAEHRLFLQQRFPDWADRVEYWHVADLDAAAVEEALSAIERGVDQLVERLANGPEHRGLAG